MQLRNPEEFISRSSSDDVLYPKCLVHSLLVQFFSWKSVLFQCVIFSWLCFQRGELAIDRAQSTEIRGILLAAMNARSTDYDQSSSGVQSRDSQLVNISNRITRTAAEHCALAESQLLEAKSSSTSCSSVADSSSCGDSEDSNHCDADVTGKHYSPNCDNSIPDEPLAETVNQLNLTRDRDADVVDKDCSPNCDDSIPLDEPLADTINQSNCTHTLEHADEIVPSETTVLSAT